MKYSEAIRLGSMMGPQGFGYAHLRVGSGTLCANEAANLAAGADDVSTMPLALEPVRCPECGASVKFLSEAVAMHLNDRHRWDRLRIADWVEAIEMEHTKAATPMQQEQPCHV